MWKNTKKVGKKLKNLKNPEKVGNNPKRVKKSLQNWKYPKSQKIWKTLEIIKKVGNS